MHKSINFGFYMALPWQKLVFAKNVWALLAEKLHGYLWIFVLCGF